VSKPYLIFTTPRSGSTWFMFLVSAYLKKKYGYKETLSQFFTNSPLHEFLYLEQGGVIKVASVRRKETLEEGKNWAMKVEERLRLLQENQYQYLLKVMACDLDHSNKVSEALANNWQWLFLTRRDRAEQALSWCLMLGGFKSHYNVSDDLKDFTCKKVIVQPNWLKDFSRQIKCYEFRKTQYEARTGAAIEISYEDLIADHVKTMAAIFPDYWSYFDPEKLKGTIDAWTIKLPYSKSKLEYIENREEVLKLLAEDQIFGTNA
jgi:LPS sulfotransferase NodH